MPRLTKTLIAGAAPVIPATSLLVMWEVVTFPSAHRVIGWLIVGYLALVLALLLAGVGKKGAKDDG